ncbi:hypothetical protein JGH11_10560 [Dysgonomonas sp. Marseille-P4677]|uniref:hypothetical protein n=1 Tax=Dysgonomonas sp. Marseille-P4677 TaxID=2364790 RepID=UPI001913C47C|nr:hypothetical protein [Dysgonomonas sp. Marseille-P4677]MBK5721313.1 hypothetical protein [Dysgonomonas sp. Marseille-P4677]
MTTPRKRHKWQPDTGTEEHFPGCYRVEKCTCCKLLKLHNKSGHRYFQSYVLNGKNYSTLPECTDIKPQKLW